MAPDNRAKVVSEATDLVPIMRVVDSETKRNLFMELTKEWMTEEEIENKFGEEGLRAAFFFEKMKLVRSKWQPTERGPMKAYKTFYKSFKIDLTVPVLELTDVLKAATMSEEKFKEIEDKIIELIQEGENFFGTIATTLHCSPTFLKGIVKRSSLLEYRGHRIELSER
ncbi:MAG TPA: hypothetical protein EYP29_04575 [Thermoplasmata archaeon]|nr:hypothetical protein [Thermoplasmata archaeon]